MQLSNWGNGAATAIRFNVRPSGPAKTLTCFFILCSADLPHEELWIALTNRSSQVIEKVKISQGGTNETSADLRIILKAAINALAAGIIVCHNHPSGNTRPSRQDDQLTQRLRDAARLIEIKLLDHIVLADGNYYSYSDDGKL